MKIISVVAAAAALMAPASAWAAEQMTFATFNSLSKAAGTPGDLTYDSATKTLTTTNTGGVLVGFQYTLPGNAIRVVNEALAANPSAVRFTFTTSTSQSAATYGTGGNRTINEGGFSSGSSTSIDPLSPTPYPTNTVAGFSFVLTQNLEVGGFDCADPVTCPGGHHTGYIYNAGSELLGGSFTSAMLSGTRGGSTANLNASTGTVVPDPQDPDAEPYLATKVVFRDNPFLKFTSPGANQSLERDFTLTMDAVNPSLLATGGTTVAPGVVVNQTLRSFTANFAGIAGSSPAPRVTAIPEMNTWGMLVMGFGVIGGSVRSTRRKQVAAAA